MNAIRETRRVMIGNTIVTADDVRELAGVVATACRDQAAGGSRFEMETSDGSTYESQTVEIFARGGTLDSKQVTRLLMSVRGEKVGDESITVFLHDGNCNPSWSFVEVKGTDDTWVNGVTRKIEEIVAGWEKQATWPQSFQWIIVLIAAFGIGQLFSAVLDRLTSFGQVQVLARLLVQFSIGVWPAALATRKLVELWPYIELRTGREHAQTLKRRKRYLWLLVTIGVFPILIRILYDAIKYFVFSK